MKRKTAPPAKRPRARDLAATRFEFWKKQNRKPRTLKAVRSSQLKHLEPHVENVAKQLCLDPSRASDRETLLRILSHVHSLRPHDNNALMQLSESVPADRSRGGQSKWRTQEEEKQLMRDIRQIDSTLSASWPERARRLRDAFPHRPEYKAGPKTLERQLRKHGIPVIDTGASNVANSVTSK
jgi:hypothetical protein